MQTICKRNPPDTFIQWRNKYCRQQSTPGVECNYESLRRSDAVKDVEEQLFKEQGGLCAYTGIRITSNNFDHNDMHFHIEHLKPQKYCHHGEDVQYTNMVACWPEPNTRLQADFGAVKKGDWPGPGEEDLFVSPLDRNCTIRFQFKTNGKIEPANLDDRAAAMTIRKLGLDHPRLVAYRKEQLSGMLEPRKRGIRLERSEAKKLLGKYKKELTDLFNGRDIALNEYCFAKMQVLEKYLRSFPQTRDRV